MPTRHHFSLSGLLFIFVFLLSSACGELLEEPKQEPETPTEKPDTPSVSTIPSGTLEFPADGGTAEIRIVVNTTHYRCTIAQMESLTLASPAIYSFSRASISVSP